MILNYLIILSFITASSVLNAANSLYCPQHHGFINPGMTINQVVAACGQPKIRNQSNNSVMKKVPVRQLIYTNLNTGAPFSGWTRIYNTWSLPSGSTGVSLQIDIMDNKVSNVNINGSSNKAMNICGGQSVEVGSSEQDVYSACGRPNMVNNSYITENVPGNQKPEIWKYQLNQYQPEYTLTFVNGELQSIQ